MKETNRKMWVSLATVLILAGVGLCAYWALRMRAPAMDRALDRASEGPPVEAPAETAAAPDLTPPPAPPVPQPQPPAQPEPPLTDERIRQLAGALTSAAEVARWLEDEHLAGRLVALVELVRTGQSPRKLVSFLKPEGRFATVERAGREYLDPKSYQRYDRLADVVASLDANGCAQLLSKLEPLLEKAYLEVGPPKRTFRQAWTEAVSSLLQVPAVDGDIPLQRSEVILKIASAELESMTDAQKHLFRMGPANIRKIQAKLRQIAQFLEWSPELIRVQPMPYAFLPQPTSEHDPR